MKCLRKLKILYVLNSFLTAIGKESRKEMKYINRIILIFSLFSLFFWKCAEREHINPFDPASKTQSPVQLQLSPDENSVYLQWNVQGIVDYTGFRVYRADNDTANFSLLTELPSSRKEYLDANISPYHWYFYRVTALGKGTESKPSNVEKTYPGPGKTWILSRYGYSVQQFSYDLQHKLGVYNTQFPPISWAWDLPGRRIWLAFAQYRYVSRLNLESGWEDFFFQGSLKRPIDGQWDDINDWLYILDQNLNMVLKLQNEAITDSLLLLDQEYLKFVLSPSQHLWVLGKENAQSFREDGNLFTIISFPAKFEGWDIIASGNTIAILIVDPSSYTSRIIFYNENTGLTDSISLNGFFTLLRKPADKNYLWLAEYLGINKYQAVKLSLNGERLLNVSGMENIYDIGINPKDYSIVIVQRYQDTIALYDSLGKRIAINTKIYDPIRAFTH